jgi:hypothetical protein
MLKKAEYSADGSGCEWLDKFALEQKKRSAENLLR